MTTAAGATLSVMTTETSNDGSAFWCLSSKQAGLMLYIADNNSSRQGFDLSPLPLYHFTPPVCLDTIVLSLSSITHVHSCNRQHNWRKQQLQVCQAALQRRLDKHDNHHQQLSAQEGHCSLNIWSTIHVFLDASLFIVWQFGKLQADLS